MDETLFKAERYARILADLAQMEKETIQMVKPLSRQLTIRGHIISLIALFESE